MGRQVARNTMLASIVALALGTGLPARAHTLPLDAAQLVALSRHVIVVRVLGANAHWNDQHTLIVTDYRVQVERRLKGDGADEITVSMAGGTVGTVTHDTCLTTPLDLGARYVLFLHDLATPALNHLVGAYQGFVREGPGSVNGRPAATGPSPALSLAGGAPISFDDFAERLTAFVLRQEADPVVLPARLLPRAGRVLGLPSKTFVRGPQQAPGPDALPAATPLAVIPQPERRVFVNAPAAPDVRRIPQRQGFEYTYRADAPEVMNQLLPSNTPWFPYDQYMMSYWNFYAGDLFRVRTTPTGSYGRDDGNNDICGFLDNTQLNATFGRVWKPTEIGVAFRTLDGGKVIEADIVLNATYPWTLDEAEATDGGTATCGFRSTMLHELGHAWGLNHPWEYQDVWWDAVMNYSTKTARTAVLWTDDTLGVRTAYGGVPRNDLALSLWTTQDDPASNAALYFQNSASPLGIFQGGVFSLAQPYKIENAGTVTVTNPSVDVFLTPVRISWDSAVYVQTLIEPVSVDPGAIVYPQPTPLTIPVNTPPGLHFVAFALTDPLDEWGDNNAGWSDFDRHLMVNSLDWWLAPASFWQPFGGAIAPVGTWVFKFDGVPWASYDFSLCTVDGGSASFSTVLRIYDVGGALLAQGVENCGTVSRILGFIPPLSGPYTVKLSGEFASSRGPFTLRYRKTGMQPVQLFVGKDLQTASVRLDWQGGQPSFDIERATRPDFADGVLLQQGWQGMGYEDPVLSDGGIYFYRVQ